MTSPSARRWRVGRGVFSSIDRDGGDGGRREVEGLEVGGNVCRTVAAAELDEADGLACGGNAGGELIKFGDLNRRVGDSGCRVGANAYWSVSTA